MRKNNQNSVGQRATACRSTRRDHRRLQHLPDLHGRPPTTYIDWRPVFEDTVGNDLRTYSGFLNDVWRVNDRVHAEPRPALRQEQTSATRAAKPVARRRALQPAPRRDVRRHGRREVARQRRLRPLRGDVHHADRRRRVGGRPRRRHYSFCYQGPAVNTGSDRAVPDLLRRAAGALRLVERHRRAEPDAAARTRRSPA